MPSADVRTSSISFSGMRTAWGTVNYNGGSDPGSTNISLSGFRGAQFTNSTSIPSSGSISINTNFKGKTFKSSGGGGKGYGCFDITTPVYLSNGTTKLYGELINGEIVKSYSINGLTETDNSNIYLNEEIPNLTGTETTSTVQSITNYTYDSYYLINESIKVTGEHPLMTKRNNAWKYRIVQDIIEGDKLYNINNGETNIETIVNITGSLDVATINVSDINTYFAGDILAHNK